MFAVCVCFGQTIQYAVVVRVNDVRFAFLYLKIICYFCTWEFVLESLYLRVLEFEHVWVHLDLFLCAGRTKMLRSSLCKCLLSVFALVRQFNAVVVRVNDVRFAFLYLKIICWFCTWKLVLESLYFRVCTWELVLESLYFRVCTWERLCLSVLERTQTYFFLREKLPLNVKHVLQNFVQYNCYLTHCAYIIWDAYFFCMGSYLSV